MCQLNYNRVLSRLLVKFRKTFAQNFQYAFEYFSRPVVQRRRLDFVIHFLSFLLLDHLVTHVVNTYADNITRWIYSHTVRTSTRPNPGHNCHNRSGKRNETSQGRKF